MRGGNGRKEAGKRMRERIVLWEKELGTLKVEQIVVHLIGGIGLVSAVQQDEAKAILMKQFEAGFFDPSAFKGVIHDSGKVETLFEALHRGGFMQEEAFLPNASALQVLGIKNL